MTKNKVLILLDGSEFRERIFPHIQQTDSVSRGRTAQSGLSS